MKSFNIFSWLPRHLQVRALVVCAVLSTILMGAMMVLDRPLKTPAAPDGIVSFELAGTAADASAILNSWDEAARISAGISLGLDYLFLLSYATALALASTLAAAPLAGRFRVAAAAGAVVAVAQYGAAALDAVENLMLIVQLTGARAAVLPSVARWCATAKFTIVGVGFGYIALAVLIRFCFRSTSGNGDAP